MRPLPLGLLLDLGCVEQGSDDRRRAYADRDAGFHQLLAAYFAGLVGLVIGVAHERLSMASRRYWEVA